jgi:hypothetical protein
MSTIRISHKRDYTCIANKAIRDKKLSYKARGIHHLLLSYPDDWIVNTAHLVNGSDEDGRDAVRSGLQELERAGYLVRNQLRNSNGQFAKTTYTVYEFPLAEEAEKPDRENPQTACQCGGRTADGFSDPILNTEIRSNDSNEILTDEVSILSPNEVNAALFRLGRTTVDPSQDPEERENLSTEVEALNPEPDQVICSALQKEYIPGQPEIVPPDTISPARSTRVTQRKTDAHFGQKQNALALQKQRAAEDAIAGSPFASVQEQDEFFMAVMKHVRSNSSRLEQGSVEAIATKIVRNVTSGKTEPKDRLLFEAWENGNLSNLQNLDNTRKEFKKQEHYAKAMQILAEIKED